MKKRSLSLLLSIVLLVVLMLGSCVSVLACDYEITVEGCGADGLVCVGDTVTFTVPERSHWHIDLIPFEDGSSFTHTFTGEWGHEVCVSAHCCDDYDWMWITIVPKIYIDGEDSGLRIEPCHSVDLSTLAIPTKEGYDFDGYTSDDVTLYHDSFRMPCKDVYLTTNWVKQDEGIDPETKRGDGYNGLLPVEEEPAVAEAPATEVPALSPQTADAAPVALLGALALVSAAAFVAMKKRG